MFRCWVSSLHLLDLTLPLLADNLALDEALLLSAEAGGPEVLRFWEWPNPAVILGAGGKWAHEADAAACERDRVPVLRRSSGGGAVVLGPGCLLYSLVLSFEGRPALLDLHGSYRYILGAIAESLASRAPGIAHAGISDLAISGRKCSGNSQQRKRTHLLHHGTLLCSFDLSLLSRYLVHPPREPEYRQRRSHPEFVTNLDLEMKEMKQYLQLAWNAVDRLTVRPQALMQKLMQEKYGKDEWHRRR